MSDELFFWQQEQESTEDATELLPPGPPETRPDSAPPAKTSRERELGGDLRASEPDRDPDGDTGTTMRVGAGLRDRLQLCLLPGLGPRGLSVLLDEFGSAGNVLRADKASLQRVPGIGPKIAHVIQTATDHVDVDQVIQWCHQHRVRILQPDAAGYPKSFDELEDTPPILFCRGEVTAADQLAVAIVGTRHATPYGLQQTRRLARDLASASVTIVSGLARGVDTAAHRAAVEVGGRTIAFLGGGLGQMYPPENAGLAGEIACSGAVISEYAPMAKPRGGMFPQRNRLIAAAGLATLVIEAPERSGSLITARLASEMGRGVGALPGPVNSRASQGCHRLIRDGGTLVTNADDVLELLGPLSQPICRGDESQANRDEREIRNGREVTLNEIERAVLDRISPTGTSLDEVTVGCELSSARVSAIVSVLEMKRLVRRLSSQYVARV
ncbi:DNA processing protein [Rhodopirellula rubra]|uniref:DNA processing protein n=1 Tax=Aporhodopirellula rubra TaxID=980271 RepID=A0A7W5E1Q1_9BACT|nr:DNA-processing protein DprA [Aporhodopirellula rubra]MBB3208565.1 DNA processing protein [Aporhodopirellula rubra]